MAENNQYIQGNETIALNKINQSHERAVQKEDHSHEEEMQKLANERAEKEQSKDLGLVGRLVGGDKNSSKNITAIITEDFLSRFRASISLKLFETSKMTLAILDPLLRLPNIIVKILSSSFDFNL